MFQLFKKDCKILRSQIAISSSKWRSRLVSTEHDALQAAYVPNSEQANKMTFTNEALSASPIVKDFLIVREKTKMNKDNQIKVLSSCAEPTIRNSRIVQNAITPRLCAGVNSYGIGSVIRKFLIPASVNKRLGYRSCVCSVIRKFRNTAFSLNQVSCSILRSVPIGRSNISCEILTPIQRIGKSLTMHTNSRIVFREIIPQRRNHAC